MGNEFIQDVGYVYIPPVPRFVVIGHDRVKQVLLAGNPGWISVSNFEIASDMAEPNPTFSFNTKEGMIEGPASSILAVRDYDPEENNRLAYNEYMHEEMKVRTSGYQQPPILPPVYVKE